MRDYEENLEKYLGQIKKFTKEIIFKNTNQIILITISFPRKGSRANTLSVIDKKDIFN